MTSAPHRRRAFTLTELIIVIGIITLLIAVLIPVISKVRYAAFAADTANELDQISTACNNYYSSFQAYPGPFSNDQLEALTTSPGGPLAGINNFELYTPGATPPYPQVDVPWPGNPWYVSGTQNLVLGLMGGLRIDPTNGNPVFSPTEVGLGPLNLNPTNPGRPSGSFFPNGTTYLLWSELPANGGQIYQSNTYNATGTPQQFTDQAQDKANDAGIPVFVDRFPTPGPLPILYLRARIGAPGIVSTGSGLNNGAPGTSITNPSTGAPAAYQYDLRDIIAYTQPNNFVSIGLGKSGQHNLQGIDLFWKTAANRFYSLKEYPKADPAYPHNNAGPYFANIGIPPTNTTNGDQYVNYTGRPRTVDQYILISAGPDGVYGTPDDITSFGDVSQ